MTDPSPSLIYSAIHKAGEAAQTAAMEGFPTNARAFSTLSRVFRDETDTMRELATRGGAVRRALERSIEDLLRR